MERICNPFRADNNRPAACESVEATRSRRSTPLGSIAASENVRRDLLTDSSGSVAVEFSLVAPMVILVILAVMSLGYLLLMGQMLDYATQRAARQVRVGTVQTNGLTQTQFRTNVVCSYLPVLFTCSDVIINLQVVPTSSSNHPNEYYAYVNSSQSALISPSLDNTTTSYCPGLQKNYVYLQILYPVSLFQTYVYNALGTTTYNGQKVHAIMATATFLNEPFGTAGTSC